MSPLVFPHLLLTGYFPSLSILLHGRRPHFSSEGLSLHVREKQQIAVLGKPSLEVPIMRIFVLNHRVLDGIAARCM
jgi:hypothetical protein